MNDISQEAIAADLAVLESELPVVVSSTSILWQTTPALLRLLDPNSSKDVKITKATRRFETSEFSYIRYIYFYSDKPQALPDKLQVTVKLAGQAAKIFKIIPSNGYGFIPVSDFCEWFEIQSIALARNPAITKISILGTSLKELREKSKKIDSFLALKDKQEEIVDILRKELSETLTLRDATKDVAEQLKEKVSALKGEIDSAQLRIEELKDLETEENASLKAVREQAALSQRELSLATNNVTQLRETSNRINREISEKDNELRTLTRSRNFISDEYGPYVKEGRGQAGLYFLAALIPLATGIVAIDHLYEGASNLLTANYQSVEHIFGAFLLRIPFAIVFSLAIYYSWRLASALLLKVFSIQTERLTLAKLLIIAREVVHTSDKRNTINDEDKFREQIHLKIEVLKAYLAKDIGRDFTYSAGELSPVLESSQTKVDDELDEESTVESKTK